MVEIWNAVKAQAGPDADQFLQQQRFNIRRPAAGTFADGDSKRRALSVNTAKSCEPCAASLLLLDSIGFKRQEYTRLDWSRVLNIKSC